MGREGREGGRGGHNSQVIVFLEPQMSKDPRIAVLIVIRQR